MASRASYEALKEENTRASKKKANNLLNGAFKTFLQQECINSQLAIALLKHPPATVDTLLESWAVYLESSTYKEEKARAQKLDETNEEAVKEKRRFFKLKMRAHHLRHQVRQARYLERNPDAITDKNQWVHDKYVSGKLSEALDESTRDHGYGMLSTGQMLENSGFRGP